MSPAGTGSAGTGSAGTGPGMDGSDRRGEAIMWIFRTQTGGSGTRKYRASFTIETTLLMMVILPVLTALLFAGFYVHDKAKLQGAACELAARGSCLSLEQDRDTQLLKVTAVLSKGGTMWAKDVHAQADAGKDQSSGVAAGSFSFPGFAAPFLDPGDTLCRGEWKRAIRHPAGLIRKVRAVKVLWEAIS